MTTIYLDTSALVKLYVEEVGREVTFQAVEDAEGLATSTVASRKPGRLSPGK